MNSSRENTEAEHMRIAVTGANGRIGRAVCSTATEQGHDVIPIDRGGTDPVDVTSYDELRDAMRGAEALIHLAAIPGPGHGPDHVMYGNNVVGNYNALVAAVELRITKVCQASSINAIGGVFSRAPQYDYFPVDELHPTYNEDAYSLSKWSVEMQADSIARRHETMQIASLRIHGIIEDLAKLERSRDTTSEYAVRQLWGYVSLPSVADACLLSLSADFTGHERFYIAAPDTLMSIPSEELVHTFYPDVPMRTPLTGNQGFFDCGKAEKILKWRHSPVTN